MLPKLENVKFKSGIELKYYYSRKISDFIKINENISEPISRYNLKVIGDINDMLINNLSPTLYKFAIIGNLARYTENYTAFRAHLTIVQSLSKQRKYVNIVKYRLKNVKINKDWVNVFEKYVVGDITDRCNRLNKSILPELIEGSDLYIYLKYLDSIGVDFKYDIEPIVGCDFNSDEFKGYCDNIITVCKTYMDSLSEDERNEISDIQNRHKLATERRRDIMLKEISDKKKESLSSSIEEICDSISIYCSNESDKIFRKDPSMCETLRKVYNKLDSLVKMYGYDKVMSDNIVVLSIHPINNNGFSKSKVKYISNGEKHSLTNKFYLSEFFLSNLNKDCIDEIKSFYSDKYIVCDVNINESYNYISTNNSLVNIKSEMSLNDYIKYIDLNNILISYKGLNIKGLNITNLLNIYYSNKNSLFVTINRYYSLLSIITDLEESKLSESLYKEIINTKGCLTSTKNNIVYDSFIDSSKYSPLDKVLFNVKTLEIYSKKIEFIMPAFDELLKANKYLNSYYKTFCNSDKETLYDKIYMDNFVKNTIHNKCKMILESVRSVI